MSSIVIYGAGAVGSALGGYLARRGHDVLLVGRPAHVRAVRARGALRVVAYEEAFEAALSAAEQPPQSLPAGAVIFLTVQAPDVAEAVRRLAPFSGHRVVTWQNGIRAEEEAADTFPLLYGGIVRFTATMLDPGEVRVRAPGQLILGRHPEGSDAWTERMVDELNDAGFTAAVSPDIRVEKALKLLVNLVSGPAVLLQRTAAEPALACLQVALLEEAGRVYAAAGIRAEPLSGLGLNLQSMIDRFRAGGSPPDGRAVYNSTWQNLHHRRPRLENAYYHGEISRLGREHGIATPVNDRVLEILEGVLREGLGPEPFDLAAFRAAFAGVVDFDAGEPRMRGTPTDGASFEI